MTMEFIYTNQNKGEQNTLEKNSVVLKEAAIFQRQKNTEISPKTSGPIFPGEDAWKLGMSGSHGVLHVCAHILAQVKHGWIDLSILGGEIFGELFIFQFWELFLVWGGWILFHFAVASVCKSWFLGLVFVGQLIEIQMFIKIGPCDTISNDVLNFKIFCNDSFHSPCCFTQNALVRRLSKQETQFNFTKVPSGYGDLHSR